MDGQSLDIKQETLNKLKEIIPNFFTEGKLDWEKLRVFFEDNIEFKNERYHLSWAGKTEAIRLLQAPTYNTLKPCREESIDFDTTENLFIEGDNLEVLKILQKSYFGKIKMIYIDPPYNTGNDFIYKDDYSETLTEYRKKVGDVDEHGNTTRTRLFKNTKENGHYHSNWLNMMYPRLFLARSLLSEDGVIFVSIDDNEVHNLRLIMDEIFGEENFVAEFVWKKNKSGNQNANYTSIQHEYIIAYVKKYGLENWRLPYSKEDLKDYKEKDEKGPFYWKPVKHSTRGNDVEIIWENKKYKIEKSVYNEETLLEMLSYGEAKFVIKSKGEIQLYKKQRLGKGILPYSLLDTEKFPMTEDGTYEVSQLFNNISVFNNPKPKQLISHFIQIGSNSSDIILDFFAGSGTTAQAVMELNKEDGGNRKFILVQLPEPTDPQSEAHKAGYKTIADIAKERIRRVANKIQQEVKDTENLDLGFKVFKLGKSNFKQWQPFTPENAEQIKQAVFNFTENIESQAKTEDILYELILKNGKKLTDKIEKINNFYVINENEIVLLLDSIDNETINKILKLKPKPKKVIALDKIFNGNDQLKTNAVLQFKDANVELKSV